MENNLSLSCKVEYSHSLWPSSSTPRYIPKRNISNCKPGVMVINIHSSIYYNSKKLKVIQILINRRLGKLWYIDTMEYYKALKMNELQHAIAWINLNSINWSKRCKFQRYSIQYHLLCIKCKSKQNQISYGLGVLHTYPHMIKLKKKANTVNIILKFSMVVISEGETGEWNGKEHIGIGYWQCSSS